MYTSQPAILKADNHDQYITKLLSRPRWSATLPSTGLSVMKIIRYHIYTIWLFLKSDVPVFVIPTCIFGLSGAYSDHLTSSSPSPELKALVVLSNIPRVLLFAFSSCLVFDVANQSIPGAEGEDAINKPWRPIPAKRISQVNARNLLLAVIPLVLVCSFYLGVYIETCSVFVVCWMYNDLGGGDTNYWVRNIHLCVAYFLYNLGSFKVAAGPEMMVKTDAYLWTATVSAVIFTTMHVQDFKDQTGDKARGRSTAPLVMGDAKARWTIAVPLCFWSVVCPLVWRCGWLGYASCIGTGGIVVARLLMLRNIEADGKTFRTWALWLTIIYSMPLLASIEHWGY